MKKLVLIMLLLTMVLVYGNSQMPAVKLMLPDNCNTSSLVENVTNETGSALAIFPNPNNGNFSLNVSFEDVIGQAEIRIVSTLGTTIYHDVIYCNSAKYVRQFNVSNLAKGNYILLFKNETKEVSTKLLIK